MSCVYIIHDNLAEEKLHSKEDITQEELNYKPWVLDEEGITVVIDSVWNCIKNKVENNIDYFRCMIKGTRDEIDNLMKNITLALDNPSSVNYSVHINDWNKNISKANEDLCSYIESIYHFRQKEEMIDKIETLNKNSDKKYKYTRKFEEALSLLNWYLGYIDMSLEITQGSNSPTKECKEFISNRIGEYVQYGKL
jgi:hypothetical protein